MPRKFELRSTTRAVPVQLILRGPVVIDLTKEADRRKIPRAARFQMFSREGSSIFVPHAVVQIWESEIRLTTGNEHYAVPKAFVTRIRHGLGPQLWPPKHFPGMK